MIKNFLFLIFIGLNTVNVIAKTVDNAIPQTIVFSRIQEPREHAFTVLVPKGWLIDGGIFRIDPTAQGGAAQSIAAKVDFTVKNNSNGDVMVRWLPDVLFIDMRNSPAGQMGLFPAGSNYNGMTVYPLVSAQDFLPQIAFPYAHPGLANKTATSIKSNNKLAQDYQTRANAMMPQLGFTYTAATVTFSYQANNLPITEKMTGIIENWGQIGAGMWGNKETLLVHAPANQYKEWEPVLSIILNSVIIDPKWMAGEIQGQIQRGQILIQTQKDIQKIENEITANRQKTYAEINNDMFLNLTGQEEYVNPYTKNIEIGSNEWNYRWVNKSGDVIYTNDQNYQPNQDVHLNRSDYVKTPIRKR